ncbi:MAG: hypothetical protein ABRQ38_05565 [Candidatus Eremiobacterota bacterium]
MDNIKGNRPHIKLCNFQSRYFQANFFVSSFSVIERQENSSLILKDSSEKPSRILTKYNNTITRQGLPVNAPAGK